MDDPAELETIARRVIESNRYMTLATVDQAGAPWASPVWYAPAGYRTFFWVSKPRARHSRNIATRPRVAIVIFDSHQPGGWQAVYMSAEAEEVGDPRIDEGIAVFTRRSEGQGLGTWTGERVRPPARHRLYVATANEQFVLDPRDERHPVTLD